MYFVGDIPEGNEESVKQALHVSSKEHSILDIVNISNKSYLIKKCDCRDGNNLYSLEEIELVEKPQTIEESQATCPYCSHEVHDSWELPDTYEGYICDRCGSVFTITVEYTASYTSDPVAFNNSIVNL
jgi:DNA-directed RNA polymerase subunit RPC12/RpoP